MTRRTPFAGLVVLSLALATAPSAQAPPPAAPPDSANFDMKRAIRDLEVGIRGREDAPAESVWKNVTTLKGMPAGRLLRVMEMGFSRGLGVNCLHCHHANDYAADDKRPKRAAREMWAFSHAVNSRLKELKELESKEPAVNCATCHRGQAKPALNPGR